MEVCRRCDKRVKLIGGLKCPECGHTAGSQNLDTDWSQYDSDLGRSRVRGADSQSRPYRGDNPKRRYPLDFKEKK